MSAPLGFKQLVEKYNGPSSSKSLDVESKQSIQVGLLDVVIDDKYEPKLVRENGRLKVVVETDTNGIEVNHPFPNPKVALLDTAETELRNTAVAEVTGFHPKGAPTSFPPSGDKSAEGKNISSVIFGQDDRVVFDNTSFPWSITGKVQTAVALGSGCMIGPRHVLTASNCVNWNADGSAGWINFTPRYYNGSGPWGTFAATSIYAFVKNTGPLSDQQTAFDYAVLVLDKRIGDTIGYAGARDFDRSWLNTVKWVSVGYPGDLTNTERPVFQGNVVITSKQDFTQNGRSGSVLGHFSDITPGMSGGPLWGTWPGDAGPRVVGVCSTRDGPPIAIPSGSTDQDNEFGGGTALVELVQSARAGAP
ncbi:trypsin-like cysteine/serine peptidase domain-containing protein [Hyaloscypha finlandica]|nr:trypsin-like cysteine/serine peptidase domain-containing protein [Hyaloscypha finlandica]